MHSVSVIGAGAWGTALALAFNRAGRKVTLWTRNEAHVTNIRETLYNERYLPGVFIEPGIHVTSDIEKACRQDIVVLAVPTQHLRGTIISFPDYLAPEIPLVICSKGIERVTNALMSEVITSILPHNPVAILSGPNFATEVAAGKPTSTTLACADERLGKQLVITLGSFHFRPYFSPDIIGAQIGGAVKNVIAIASGIAIGRELGENARAAMMTRGLAEIVRLSCAKGGAPLTLMGLCGIGDLMLTCYSHQSRNTALGYAIGQGLTKEAALAESRGVAEGVDSSQSLCELGEMHNVEMPLCRAVYEILHCNANVDATIEELLSRPYTREMA